MQTKKYKTTKRGYSCLFSSPNDKNLFKTPTSDTAIFTCKLMSKLHQKINDVMFADALVDILPVPGRYTKIWTIHVTL